jgi:hypothetical protein
VTRGREIAGLFRALSDAERLHLILPAELEINAGDQRLRGEVRRLISRFGAAAIVALFRALSGLDHLRREKREVHEATDVTIINALALGKLGCRFGLLGGERLEPPTGTRDGLNENRIDLRQWGAGTIDDELHLDAATPDAEHEAASPLAPAENYIRQYRRCKPPRAETATIWPNRWIGR